MDWISVKERLPGEIEEVLATNGFSRVVGQIYEEDGLIFCYDGEFGTPDITHWMYLPDLQKED